MATFQPTPVLRPHYTRLSGAALAAHQRKVSLDLARSAIRRRDPLAVNDTLAFLRAATPHPKKGTKK